jgi:hypothetical protein
VLILSSQLLFLIPTTDTTRDKDLANAGSIVCQIAGGLSVKWGGEPIWGWREFTSDINAWPVISLNIIILGFFIYNSWKRAGRYGASSDNLDSGNGRGESGSTGPAYFPPNAWKVPQSGSHGQIQILGKEPSPHIVHVTVKEIGKEDM